MCSRVPSEFIAINAWEREKEWKSQLQNYVWWIVLQLSRELRLHCTEKKLCKPLPLPVNQRRCMPIVVKRLDAAY